MEGIHIYFFQPLFLQPLFFLWKIKQVQKNELENKGPVPFQSCTYNPDYGCQIPAREIQFFQFPFCVVVLNYQESQALGVP